MTPTGPLEAELAELLEPSLTADADEWYHTRDSRRSREGFPDYVIVVGPWLIFAELKRQGESVTADQARWLRLVRGPWRLALVVGGVEGVQLMARALRALRSGTVDGIGAAGARVQVLGEVSPASRLAVAGDDAGVHRGAEYAAAGSPTPPTRRRRGTR